MNKSQLVTLIIVAAFVALLVGINSVEPSRVSARQQQEAAEAAAQIAEAEAAEAKTNAATQELSAEQMQVAQQPAPSADVPASMDPYQVEFTCSNGTFVIEVHPEWAPIGAEQLRLSPPVRARGSAVAGVSAASCAAGCVELPASIA